MRTFKSPYVCIIAAFSIAAFLNGAYCRVRDQQQMEFMLYNARMEMLVQMPMVALINMPISKLGSGS